MYHSTSMLRPIISLETSIKTEYEGKAEKTDYNIWNIM